MAGSYPISPTTWRPLPLRRAPNNATLLTGERALVETILGATLLQAPSPAADGSTFQVTDLDGLAATNNITIDGNGALIDGVTTDTLDVAFEEATYIMDDGEWRRALFPRQFDDDPPLQPHFRRSDVLAGIFPPIGAPDTEFWVDSVAGDDTNPGTQAEPFKTLEHAYDEMPGTLSGKGRIHLVGAGPYTQPEVYNGPYPNGPNGQPLVILGDTFTQLFTGSVTLVAGAVVTVAGGGMTVNAFRGKIYHGLTGTSAGQYRYIARNDATTLSSLSNTFAAAIGDTFEILEPQTVIDGASPEIVGGRMAFYAIKIACATSWDVVDQASVLYDAVEFNTPRYDGRFRSKSYFAQISVVPGFSMVTDVGTQLGSTGMFFNATGTVAAIITNGSLAYGYLVCLRQIQIVDQAYLDILGIESNLAGLAGTTTAISIDKLSLVLFNAGWNRITGSALATSTGLGVLHMSHALLLGAPVFEDCGLVAIRGLQGSYLSILASGSSGNGAGVWVDSLGSIEKVGTPTVTGTFGDIGVGDGGTPGAGSNPILWTQVPSSGSFPLVRRPATTKTAGYAMTREDAIVPVDMVAAAASLTITLPSAATLPDGWSGSVFDLTGGTTALKTLTIARSGADVIDGAVSVVKVLAFASLTVQKSGTGRFKIVASVN